MWVAFPLIASRHLPLYNSQHHWHLVVKLTLKARFRKNISSQGTLALSQPHSLSIYLPHTQKCRQSFYVSPSDTTEALLPVNFGLITLSNVNFKVAPPRFHIFRTNSFIADPVLVSINELLVEMEISQITWKTGFSNMSPNQPLLFLFTKPSFLRYFCTSLQFCFR